MYVTILSTQRSEIGSMASANTSEWRQLRPDGTAKLDNLISKTDICVIVPKAAWPTHIGEYRLGILARDFPKGTIHKLLRCLSAEIRAVMTQNWENWKITKNGWLDPLYQYMYDIKSICRKISLFIKKYPKPHWKWAKYDKTKLNWELMCIV